MSRGHTRNKAVHSLYTEHNSLSWTDLQTLSMSREGPKIEIYRQSPPCIPSGTILPFPVGMWQTGQ